VTIWGIPILFSMVNANDDMNSWGIYVASMAKGEGVASDMLLPRENLMIVIFELANSIFSQKNQHL